VVREKLHNRIVLHPSRFCAIGEVCEVYKKEREKERWWLRLKGFDEKKGVNRANRTRTHIEWAFLHCEV
jgi:hypothetical protein